MQFIGHGWHLPLIKLDPFRHEKHIEVFVPSHSRHTSWPHLKQTPAVLGYKENGILHVSQILGVEGKQLEH